MPWICEVSLLQQERLPSLPIELLLLCLGTGEWMKWHLKSLLALQKPSSLPPRLSLRWAGMPGMWMWEREGSKGRSKLWPVIEGDGIFAVSHSLQSPSKISFCVPLLRWMGVDDEAENQKGELYSNACQLGILGRSFPFSCFFPFYEVGMVITSDDLWIEDSVNKRCIMFGTCNTSIMCYVLSTRLCLKIWFQKESVLKELRVQ